MKRTSKDDVVAEEEEAAAEDGIKKTRINAIINSNNNNNNNNNNDNGIINNGGNNNGGNNNLFESRWYRESERLAQRLRIPGMSSEDAPVDMGNPRSELELLRILGIFKEHLIERTEHHMGYPYNLHFDWNHEELSKFLRFSINNLGDPFVESNYGVHSRHFELEVLEFFAKLWKLSLNEMWGYVTTCGTEGNLHGILVGRETLPEGILYYSKESHYCVAKAGRFYRMKMIEVKAHYSGEIDLEDLEIKLSQNRDKPAILSLNDGTTVKGAIDDIDGVLDVLHRQGFTEDKFYIHVDGALMGICTPFLKDAPKYDFTKPIGSFSCSGHKFIGCPMPSGVILVRKKYIANLSSDIEYLNSKDTTIMGSRNGQAPLFLWYQLMKKGLPGLEADVRYSINTARLLKSMLSDAGISCMLHPTSVTVVFQRPQDERFVRKWQLACEGDIAHVLCMPNTKEEKLKEFVAELLHTMQSKVANYLGCYSAQMGPNCRCAECAMNRRFEEPRSGRLIPLNSPFLPFAIQTANKSDISAGAANVCRMVPGWENTRESDLQITRVSGGITNILLLVTHKTRKIDPILLRLYGKNTEEFINRNKENRLMEYIYTHLNGAIKLYGRFQNGRLEQFVVAKTMNENTMKDAENLPGIAAAMAELHSLKPGAPLNPEEPMVWRTISSLYDLVLRENERKPYVRLKYPLETIGKEVESLKIHLQTVPSTIVLCHNDLLAGNILKRESDGKILFVDWEYCDYNYRGYDLGNYFCEWGGLECDISKYPNEAERLNFLTQYKKAANCPETVEQLLKESDSYAPASQLMWGLWGLAQARFSEVEFDYEGFSNNKFTWHFTLSKSFGYHHQNGTTQHNY